MKNIELPAGLYVCLSEPKTEMTCFSANELGKVLEEKTKQR
jgi:hypothetical protein